MIATLLRVTAFRSNSDVKLGRVRVQSLIVPGSIFPGFGFTFDLSHFRHRWNEQTMKTDMESARSQDSKSVFTVG